MINRAEVDVAVANAASKAILRAAVEEWVSRHPHIHYFPSYEIVLCSDPRRVWTEDFRHITPEIIGHIGKLFLRKFAGAEAGAGQSFGAVLKEALGSVLDAGRKSDAQTVAMTSGKANVMDVVTAVAETDVAVSTLVSVRDRVIQSYEDIMKMPI